MTSVTRATHRYLIHVSYVGTNYKGLQRLTPRNQPNPEASIQEAIEAALEGLKPQNEVKMTSSSRTDSGVHANHNCFTAQLNHRYDGVFFLPNRILNHCNDYFAQKGHQIRVEKIQAVRPDFHPRALVSQREYIYRIAKINAQKHKSLPKVIETRTGYKSKSRGPNDIDVKLLPFLPFNELYRALPVMDLNLEKVEQVLELYRGEHDFASFTRKLNRRPVESTIRTMNVKFERIKMASQSLFHPLSIQHDVECQNDDIDIYHIRFISKSFLYNQIRRMMGTLLAYACEDLNQSSKIKFDRIEKMLSEPTPASFPMNVKVARPWGLYLNRLTLENFEELDLTDENTIRELRLLQEEQKLQNINESEENINMIPEMNIHESEVQVINIMK